MLISSADGKVTRKRNAIFINVPNAFISHQDISILSATEAAEAPHLQIPLLPLIPLVVLAASMAPTQTPFAFPLKSLPPSEIPQLNSESMQKLDDGM